MTNHSTHAKYYGANVRIVTSGTGLDGQLIVQRLNPLAGNWIVAAIYNQDDNYCYTDAAAYADHLAHKLFLESKA